MTTPIDNLGRTILLALVVGATAYDDTPRLGPLAPSGTGTPSAVSAQAVHEAWSPYVGIHVTGEATAAYRDALLRLAQAGRLRGARVEINTSTIDAGASIIRGIGGLGIELLGLIGNDFLFDDPIEATIDRIFSAYPEIRYFQIGNEITTILPSSGRTMTIEQYMEVFQRVYAHVQARYAGQAVLLTQSTLGSGQYGPRELETMAALGLAEMNPERVILAINDYDPHEAVLYAGLLGTTLRRFRVWVTESGVPTPEQHASFVQAGYPLLRNYLRAERIYWYVLWGGDAGGDAGFTPTTTSARNTTSPVPRSKSNATSIAHLFPSGFAIGYRKDALRFADSGHMFHAGVFRSVNLGVFAVRAGGGMEWGVPSLNFDTTEFDYRADGALRYSHIHPAKDVDIPIAGTSKDGAVYPFGEVSIVQRPGRFLIEGGMRVNIVGFQFDNYEADTADRITHGFSERNVLMPYLFVNLGFRVF